MAYLGNVPARSFISFERQVFTIVNSQTAYTLSHSVTNENDIRLVVNNVVQEPGSGKAYTATGTTLTLSAALTNGTDEMYCVFLGRAVGTVNAPAGSVDTAQLAADAVTNAKIADDAISDEQLDPTVITGQTAETSIATDDLILLSDTSASGALKKMTRANFVSGIGGTNTPAVFARLSSSQTIPGATTTTVAFANEIVDTNSAFNTSTYTFTVPSGEAGLYSVSVFLRKSNWNAARWYIDLLTSGGNFVFEHGTDASGNYNTTGGTIITNLSVGNTVYARTYQGNGSDEVITNDGSYLAIHKLIQ
jgi:hypothetical protein